MTKLSKMASVDLVIAVQNAGTTRFLRGGQVVDDDSDDPDEDLDGDEYLEEEEERGPINVGVVETLTSSSQKLKESSQSDDTAKAAAKKSRKSKADGMHKEVGPMTNGRQTLKSSTLTSLVGREN
ncbi:hypothetical protein BBJ29_009980 [Phytophthora kernoviae]|uniref:Uncharacterized protein n=1 Tax=Phytophthora kernoviae TaxID=325452 RepID=A0A421G6G4_9STRA|nr:hypothetical protein BBJ29_009980 [Phytophthora kernoviae]